jgi:hypothetical protein
LGKKLNAFCTNLIYDMLSSLEMGGACSTYGGRERFVQGSGGKPEGKRPLGRPRHRWEDNVKMDLREVGCGREDWIGLAQDRARWWALVSAVRNLRVP